MLHPMKTAAIASAVIFFAGLCGSYFLFSQGVSGGFLFDDANNLAGLAKLKERPGATEFWRYILSGFSGPSGRPLSLATFAAQHVNWPRHPDGFKHVNILIHLLNGTLLFWVLVKLSPLLPAPSRQFFPLVGALSAAVWLIHPLQVSSVLYVIQRMTELSTLFMLLGVLTYLFERKRLLQKTDLGLTSYIPLTMGFGTCLLLGTLSKENAILLPLLVIVLEVTLLNHLERPRHARVWASVFLFLPIFFLIAYLFRNISEASYVTREFTLHQRLLTEPRILFDYLAKISLLNTHDIGKLFSEYRHSTSIFRPPATLIAISALVALLILGIASRRKHPFLGFGILWFLASHSLESTVIPLELYFEHRNYLASIGPIVSILYYSISVLGRIHSNVVRAAFASGLVGYILLMGILTYQISSMWGKPLQQAAIWANEQATLKRARNYYAYVLLKSGLPDRAADEYFRLAGQWPNDPAFPLAIADIVCLYPHISTPDMNNIGTLLQRNGGNVLLDVYFLNSLVSQKEDGYCISYSSDDLKALVESAISNSFYSTQKYNLKLLLSRIALLDGNKPVAYAHLADAVILRPEVPLLLQLIVWDLEDDNYTSAARNLHNLQTNTYIPQIKRWLYSDSINKIRKYITTNADSTSRHK